MALKGEYLFKSDPKDQRKNMRKLINMKPIAVITAVAALLSSGALVREADIDEGRSKAEHRGQLSKKDYKFAHDAALGGLMEVRLGELAKQKAANQTVQQFGDRM